VAALAKPYIIGVSSQKGGVGKTTISINLAIALKDLNYSVLLVDSDITNPSIGIHLGLEKVNIGYRDVLYGNADMGSAVVVHGVTGLHVLPGTLVSKKFPSQRANIQKLGNELQESSPYNFIILDTAPGLIDEDLSSYYDEALIITTPEMSACASSLRLAQQYDQMKVKHNMVVNKIRNRSYEVAVPEIETIYEKKVLGSIPEDETVPISIAEHIPAYIKSPNSKFSLTIKGIARKYAPYSNASSTSNSPYDKIIAFLKRIFGIK
jgi:MinD-like ATPase involved in chromosome partitioning or flagellar assembly